MELFSYYIFRALLFVYEEREALCLLSPKKEIPATHKNFILPPKTCFRVIIAATKTLSMSSRVSRSFRLKLVSFSKIIAIRVNPLRRLTLTKR